MFAGLPFAFPERNRPFQSVYKCFSVSMFPGSERQDVEKGGKIIMPPSALEQLTRLNIVYPMVFKLQNTTKDRITHAGVLEFIADEGMVYLPYWMMRNLFLDEGDLIDIESVSLPVATYSKFQPQSSDFLDITNPKAMLENALRNFACLTRGDMIAIKYNQKLYELYVLDTKPGKAVTIIECDMNVEFEAPIGYKEQCAENVQETQSNDVPMEYIEEPTAFIGVGMRLDGKQKKKQDNNIVFTNSSISKNLPDYEHPFGLLRFDRTIKPIDCLKQAKKEETKKEDDFEGQGFHLKRNKKLNT